MKRETYEAILTVENAVKNIANIMEQIDPRKATDDDVRYAVASTSAEMALFGIEMIKMTDPVEQ